MLTTQALVLFVVVSGVVSSQDATTRRMNDHVDKMKATIDNVYRMISEVYEVRDKCFNGSAGGYKNKSKDTSPVDIYAMRKDEKGGNYVNVEVPSTYYDCLKGLDPKVVPPEKARIWCIRVVLWQYHNDLEKGDYDDDLKEAYLLQYGDDKPKRNKRGTTTIRQIAPRPITSPLTGYRTRQEYRTLSVDQRNRFHAAMNTLYRDGTVTCFALVHRNALRTGGAHGGDAFLPWHRAFLALFEEALRRVDPSVSIPYWDSTFDDNMAAGPGFSVMWDNTHMGSPVGVVDEGPFAGWQARENPLERNVARGTGSLVRQARVDELLQLCLLDEFTLPWENTHNSVHVWVGGTMEDSMAAADPVFYMHHAFVDYVWEKFRQRQRAVCGVDPASDYPPVDPALPEHGPDRNMTGMTFLTNREGIADYWIANWFNYTDTPTCPSCGNSPDLYCDTDINRCVSASNFSFGEATIGPTAQGLGLAPPPGTAPQRATARPVSPASTTPKAATYADSVKTGGKPYEGSCSKDPYARSCVKRPQPSTPAELVNAMSLNKVPKPKPLDDVYERIKALLKKGERYPPGSEAKFFKMKPDEENDCRCLDKYIRDPLVAYVEKGRKLSKSGPKLYDTYT